MPKALRAKLLNSAADVAGSGFYALADRLLSVGYDQALRDMVAILDHLAAGYGLDFDPDAALCDATPQPKEPTR